MKIMKRFVAVLLAAVTVATVTPSAVKADGWVEKKEGYYYVYNNGEIAKNTVIGIFAVGPTGLVTHQEAIDQTNRIIAMQQAQAAQPQVQAAPAPAAAGDLYSRCAAIVNSATNSSMSDIDKIRALYNYMMAATSYKRDNTKPVGNYGPQYAYEALTTGQGNCYRYASAYAYLLKAAGIESRIAYGQIHAARGGLTPHSWTEVNIGGNWYTVDCEMQDAKGTKYDFFLKTYEEYPVKPLVPQGYLPVAF